MNIERIADQVERYGYRVALDAYQLGIEHARGLFVKNVSLPDTDDLTDELREIAHEVLQGVEETP